MTTIRKKISKSDIIVIAILVLITFFSFMYVFFPRPAGTFFKITVGDDSYVYAMDQYKDYVFESEGYTLTVCVSENGVSVSESTCPDKICVNTGCISRPGQTIVCIPAKAVIEICSGGESDEDFVVG